MHKKDLSADGSIFMRDKKNEKLFLSLNDLKIALKHYQKISYIRKEEKRLAFLSLSKAFEMAVQYSCMKLKSMLIDEGLDPQSPKAAVRDAAKVGIIEDAAPWMLYINTRNSGVHDYFAVPEKKYVAIAKNFLEDVKRIFPKNRSRKTRSNL